MNLISDNFSSFTGRNIQFISIKTMNSLMEIIAKRSVAYYYDFSTSTLI